MQALVDNDVLHKTAAYQLLLALLGSKPYGASSYAVLGTAPHVVPKKMKKKLQGDILANALLQFQETLKLVTILEPTTEEIKLAAQLERMAQENNLQLDSGESQLCAVLHLRGDAMIFTGDKRAITAMASAASLAGCGGVAGYVVCLEQLFLWLIAKLGHAAICAAVCAGKDVDKAITMCFGCYSGGASQDSVNEGLSSYINSIEQGAPGILLKL